jgi:type IV secretion system protein VirB11
MLRTALGADIMRLLEEPAVVEVMLNPDGRLWVDRLSEGLADTGERLSSADGERIVRLVAHHVGAEVHARSPRVSAELPETGERFEGLLPPVVAAPTFAIRKPAVAVFSLDDYVAAGIMSEEQAATLRAAVISRANILVAGGTSTGDLSRQHLSRSGLSPCRCRAQGGVRGSRDPLRLRLLPDLPLSAAGRGSGARRDLALRGP